MDQHSQLEEIKKKRLAKFAAMGVTPTFTPDQVHEAQASSSFGGNMATRDRINAIKNGQMRDVVKEYTQAKSPTDMAPSSSEFRVKNNNPLNRAQKNESISKLGLDKSSKPTDARSQEARSIEAMFETGGSSFIDTGDVVMGNDWQERKNNANPPSGNLISEEIIPSSSWENQFKNKLSAHPKGFQGNSNLQENNHYVENGEDLTEAIKRIANGIVDKRMADLVSKVISTQSTQPKNSGLSYKKVTNKKGETIKDVISIDGKFYRLEEVKYKS